MGGQSHTAEVPKTYELAVCKWEGRVHCVYLNDYRVAGGKPWGGSSEIKTWNVTAADIYNAIPEMRRTALEDAAPELLEAAKWAEAALAPFSKEPAEKSGISLLRIAIAKATGESAA